MITSIGIDIAETKRLGRDIELYGERFVRRILTSEELAEYHSWPDKAAYLAGRFAAKEAVIKALGHYLKDRPPLNVIQVSPEDDRRHLRLPDDIGTLLGDARCLISISYNECHATAIAVFTEEK